METYCIKIHIHHEYNEFLYDKIAHNTKNKKIKKENNFTVVDAEYKNKQFKFIFGVNQNTDDAQINIIDWVYSQKEGWKNKEINFFIENEKFKDDEGVLFLKYCNSFLKNKNNWIIFYLRTEKILVKNDFIEKYDINYLTESENEIEKLKNNYIITDNIFFNSTVSKNHSNLHFVLTNTIFQWKELLGINLFYEFSKIKDRINYEYDLMYSVRNHKQNRTKILNELQKLNNKKILLQRTNALTKNNNKKQNYYYNSEEVQNIPINNIYGEYDFENISLIPWNHNLSLDLFFRVLSKAKMQILCESWSFYKGEFSSQYLSEKTYGLLLANIPFISTHHYPLEIISKILEIEYHPFYTDIKLIRGNEKKFAYFVKDFMENFESNYQKCKLWSEKCHNLLVAKLQIENDFLNLLINNFNKTTNEISSKKII